MNNYQTEVCKDSNRQEEDFQLKFKILLALQLEMLVMKPVKIFLYVFLVHTPTNYKCIKNYYRHITAKELVMVYLNKLLRYSYVDCRMWVFYKEPALNPVEIGGWPAMLCRRLLGPLFCRNTKL